jgi:hypothetical protein
MTDLPPAREGGQEHRKQGRNEEIKLRQTIMAGLVRASPVFNDLGTDSEKAPK